MKMHRFVVYVVDFEDAGVDACAQVIEDNRYVNARVLSRETADIGPWDDNIDINKTDSKEVHDKYFGEKP